jgi:3-hydroxybutyryl-CoA dehydrogenase
VVVREVAPEYVERARVRLETSLEKAVEREKMAAADREAAIARVRFTTDLADLADRQLVIEAVMEDEEEKARVFAGLDEVVTADTAVLASNTSSIPIMKLAMATKRPEWVVGLHFFNPVPVMRLVEVVPSLLTGEEAVLAASDFVRTSLGKEVVTAPDRAGFIVNALLVPYLLDAIRFYEAGHASAVDIDNGMRLGANHPMGPLALCDLIGNDTLLGIAHSLHGEFTEPRFAPPPLLRRLVEAGMLGRKSGRGFFDYRNR